VTGPNSGVASKGVKMESSKGSGVIVNGGGRPLAEL
jgi:hypothetical protein